MSEETRLQSFRRGPMGRVFQVEAHHHPDSAQHIVFWEDIQELFPGASSVLHGTVAVSRARDASFRFIEPRCIKYQPEKVLEVVGAEDLSTMMGAVPVSTATPHMTEYSQQLTLRNIEQWAMATAEITGAGTMYPPSVYSQSTDTSRPFKPLSVPTETEASTVHEESADEDEGEENKENATNEDDASMENSFEPAMESVELVPTWSTNQGAHREEDEIVDEAEDMQDGKPNSPLLNYREMAPEDMLLLRGLPHLAEYNHNASMARDDDFRGNGDVNCGSNYVPYINSSTDNSNNNKIIAMVQDNLEGDGSDQVSATPMFPTTNPPTSPFYMQYPPSLPRPSITTTRTPTTTSSTTASNTPATAISTAATKPSPPPPAMLPSKGNPGFLKATFDRLARKHVSTSSIVTVVPQVNGVFAVDEDGRGYMAPQELQFGANDQFSQQQYQQQQGSQTQTQLWAQALAQEDERNHQQDLLSQQDCGYQHQRAQGEGGPVAFMAATALETLPGSGSTSEPDWQRGNHPVLNGTDVVTRARDAALRLCVKYQAGKVLEVLGGEDLATLGESTFAPTPMPGQLTYKNIEQWAAKTTPEDTMLGGIYAPTVCTLTTTKTGPFKPLYVPTEADAKSVWDEEEEGDDLTTTLGITEIDPPETSVRCVDLEDILPPPEDKGSRVFRVNPDKIPLRPQSAPPQDQQHQQEQIDSCLRTTAQQGQSQTASALWNAAMVHGYPPWNTVNALHDPYQSASYSPAITNVPSTRNHRNHCTDPQIASLGASLKYKSSRTGSWITSSRQSPFWIAMPIKCLN